MGLWDYFKTKVCSDELNELKWQDNINLLQKEELIALEKELNKATDNSDYLLEELNECGEKLTNTREALEEARTEGFKNDLPSCFEPTTQNYRGNCTIISKLEEKEWTYKKASDGMELTPLWDDYLKACKIKSTDTALQVFNKILATEQRLVKYVQDVKQWGKGESWQRAAIEWMTKKSDCENNALRVVSVFEYYQLINGRFADAFAFVGTGLFQKKFGHAFPCLFFQQTEISGTMEDFLMNDLYIGEATLDAEIPARELKLVKDRYDLSWGNFSFWHNFRLKEELKWW